MHFILKIFQVLLFVQLTMISAFRMSSNLMKPARGFIRPPVALFSTDADHTTGDKETRNYSSFSVYKGKAALNAKPIFPTFVMKGSGKTVQKEGALLLEFAPAGTNAREYDWSKKQYFSLSVVELGELIGLDKNTLEFFHDPNKGSK
jgi:hypothetical protein